MLHLSSHNSRLGLHEKPISFPLLRSSRQVGPELPRELFHSFGEQPEPEHFALVTVCAVSNGALLVTVCGARNRCTSKQAVTRRAPFLTALTKMFWFWLLLVGNDNVFYVQEVFQKLYSFCPTLNVLRSRGLALEKKSPRMGAGHR